MSDALDKAEAAARDAAVNTAAVQIALAAVELAKAAQQQPACHHPAPEPQFQARKWIVIGAVTVCVGLVGALFAVAITIGACCATGCLLILRSMWRDSQKGR